MSEGDQRAMTDSAVPSNETWDVIRHLFEGGELCGQTNRTDDGDSHVCGCFRKPHADANHVCPCGSRWSTDGHIDGARRDEELLGRVWDTWGSLSTRQKRRIARRHPELAIALETIQTEVTQRLGSGLRWRPWLTGGSNGTS